MARTRHPHATDGQKPAAPERAFGGGDQTTGVLQHEPLPATKNDARRFKRNSPARCRQALRANLKAFGTVLISAVLTFTSGCSASPDRAQVPTAASTFHTEAASPTPTATRFERLNYQFRAPGGWLATEGYLPWDLGSPHLGVPMFDSFVSPDGGIWWIVVGKRPTKEGVSRDEWIQQMLDQHAITYTAGECREAEEEAEVTLDSEHARSRAFHCPTDGPNAMAVQVLATHHDNGWVVMCYSEEEAASTSLTAFEQQCDTWLKGFRFNT